MVFFTTEKVTGLDSAVLACSPFTTAVISNHKVYKSPVKAIPSTENGQIKPQQFKNPQKQETSLEKRESSVPIEGKSTDKRSNKN